MSDQGMLRIAKEVKQLQKSSDLYELMNTLPWSFEIKALAIDFRDDDIRNVRALIMGPPETSYQFGFFEFSIKFGKGYPTKPPAIQALTTNKGRCRFNPNIYASGRVCLSILGTWHGNRSEQWSSAQGLESVLISIQSLMSNNPYENEPGFENANTSSDKENQKNYVEKIQHESLRLAVIEPLESSFAISAQKPVGTLCNEWLGDDDDDEWEEEEENYDPFLDLRKRRFLWYFDLYMNTIEFEEAKTSRTRNFQRMPFESAGNTMDGHFNYPELKRRLTCLREAILAETHRWPALGLDAQKEELGIAANLQRQYEQIVEDLKRQKIFHINLCLVDGNPFLWECTYFGQPMSHLDGGVFKFKIYLSPRFPDEQPRVFMEKPVFHIRVSKEGVMCYFPQRTEEMRHHIEAIVGALEEESPPYDPRTTVNPAATKLFWGSPEDRKIYNRNLRKAIEATLE
ncbi:hypothetical protein FE257_005138 [Aspergillus nanangensis]|uniref:Ubiquitin-conjugating enzyme E2 Z n=1 Tax=Aspergillus nanangensis TaxID=2582783 RepID=A0AAD4GMY8_ASPNN|nr:hypothetical protein FE257_005138 [Aspergillus nanangensis]